MAYRKASFKCGLVAFLLCIQYPSFAQSTASGSVFVSGQNPSASKDESASKKLAPIIVEMVEDEIFSRPVLEGKAGISLFSEDTYDGKNASQQPINSYARAYVMGNLYFTDQFYLSGNFRGTSSSGNNTVGNYFFDDGSAFIAELALRYDSDQFSLVAGHTNINYSLSRSYSAGMWGSTLARAEYGVDGMMVLGGQYKINAGDYGNHALSGSVFMVDTTALSDTYGASKNPTPLSKGGPANTGKFNNYAIALDGLKIKYLPKLRYQIAAVQMTTQSQSVFGSSTIDINPAYLATEQRYVGALLWDKLDFVSDVKVTPLFEYNSIINSLGISGYNRAYYTGSLLFTYKQWNFGFSGSVWDTNWSKVPNGAGLIPSNNYLSDRNNQAQVALGYSFQNGVKAVVGYRKENKYINTNTQTVGVNLSYDLPFAF